MSPPTPCLCRCFLELCLLSPRASCFLSFFFSRCGRFVELAGVGYVLGAGRAGGRWVVPRPSWRALSPVTSTAKNRFHGSAVWKATMVPMQTLVKACAWLWVFTRENGFQKGWLGGNLGGYSLVCAAHICMRHSLVFGSRYDALTSVVSPDIPPLISKTEYEQNLNM